MTNNNKNVANYRDRLRAKGLIKKEVWIPPRFSSQLKQVELALRSGILPIIPENTENEQMYERMKSLMNDLQEHMAEVDFADDVNMVLHDNGVLEFVVNGMHEFTQVLVEAGETMLVSTNLVRVQDIPEADRAFLNQAMLELNTRVPLSNFSITNGHYSLDGQLSADSKIEVILQEVVTLADNVVEALEFIDENVD